MSTDETYKDEIGKTFVGDAFEHAFEEGAPCPKCTRPLDTYDDGDLCCETCGWIARP